MRFPSEASLTSLADTGGHRETSEFELEDGDKGARAVGLPLGATGSLCQQ